MSEAAAETVANDAAPERATDAELMAATRDGCRRSFGVLVDRYKDALVGYLARLTGSPDRAEDLAQDAFLRLYQSAGRYDERGRLQGLLYAIATNLLRTEERRRRRWRLLMPFLASPTTSNGFDLEEPPLGERRVLQRELGVQLQAAIAELPLRYRVPLVLYELDEWSYAEIADHLEVSEGTIKSRIHRARQKLKEKLTPYWNEGATNMEQGMDDRRLDESLRRLPEARAGEGFTATVVARLAAGDAEAAPATSWWAAIPRLAATAAVLLVAVAFGFWIALPSPTAPDGGDTPAAVAAIAPPADTEPDTEPVPARVATRAADDAPATVAPPATAPPVTVQPATTQPTAALASDARLDREAAARRLAELRRERERLVSDLATLAAAERPTVVLGGDETVELVLDFAEPGFGAVRPASYRPNDSD